MGKPRLPWKRGFAAWRIAASSEAIQARLDGQRRSFFSLRQTARILGVSTQPVRDWVRLNYLRRDGPRAQFARTELERFIRWLETRAEPFPPERYTERFVRKTGKYPLPFHVLHHAKFLWPKGHMALAPRELAVLIGCHSSLINKAINYYGRQLARRKSPSRWEITRHRWQNTFFFSHIGKPSLPILPRQPLFSTTEAAEILGRWGVSEASVRRVREMIRDGPLEGIPPSASKGRWQVLRKSLEIMRKTLLTG